MPIFKLTLTRTSTMNRKILFMGMTLSILLIAISTQQIMAQNVTTNASNAVENMTAAANQTAYELGQKASSVLNNAGDKVGSALGELKQNMSDVGTGLGQNMSDVGTEILNKTEEAAKKVGTGAADVLSNISGEIKEGINGK
jgi:cell division septum initiation protein DivIVA